MNEMIPEESKNVKNSRLCDLEKMIPTLQGNLDAQDKLINDLQCKAVLHESKLAENFDSLSLKLDAFHQDSQEKNCRAIALHESLSTNLMSLHLKIEKQEKEIEALKSQVESLMQSLNAIKENQVNFATLCHVKALTDELEVHKSYLKVVLQEAIDYHNKVHVEHKYSISCLKEDMEAIKKEIPNNANKIYVVEKAIQDVASEIKMLLLEYPKQIQDAKFDVLKSCDDKIIAIPKPLIPSLDDAKNAMKTQLEPVVLDAKNANLRSTNTDVKVHILEKKLEQLKLMVDQINLQD